MHEPYSAYFVVHCTYLPTVPTIYLLVILLVFKFKLYNQLKQLVF